MLFAAVKAKECASMEAVGEDGGCVLAMPGSEWSSVAAAAISNDDEDAADELLSVDGADDTAATAEMPRFICFFQKPLLYLQRIFKSAISLFKSSSLY